MKDAQEKFDHPYDNPISSGLRFLVELIAWVAGPWAAAFWNVWAAIPVLIVLVGLPSVFSTRGDKRQVLVPTPGIARVGIELILYGVALIAPWLVWLPRFALVSNVVVLLALVLGLKRLGWLLRGAPPPP